MKWLIFFSSIIVFQNPCSGQLPEPKLQIMNLTGNFYVYTTYGEYNNVKYPANGMYVITSAGAVIFDTPWDTTQFQPLLDSILVRHQTKAVLCFATHFHEDRTAGLEYYSRKGIQTFTTRHTDSLSQARGMKRAQYLMNRDTSFVSGGYKFDVYYPGPGHAPDNIVIWFPEQRILYGGCLVKSTDDQTLGNLNDANVNEYAKTLSRVIKRSGDAAFVIPGHNSWRNNRSLYHCFDLAKKLKKDKAVTIKNKQ